MRHLKLSRLERVSSSSWLVIWLLLWLPHLALAWTRPLRFAATSPPSLFLVAKKNEAVASAKREFDICNNPRFDPFAAFLAGEIGLTDPAKIKKIAERAPDLLSYTEAALKERFVFFRDLFNYSNDDLQKVMLRGARVFAQTSQTLRTKIEQFSKILGIDNDLEAVSVVLLKHPVILSRDMKKNMKPKVEYLRERVFQDDNDAMIIALTNNPAVFTISLDNRIIPRTEALLAAGVSPSNHISKSYKTTDAQFQTWFEKKTSTCLPDDWSPREQSTLSQQERYQQRIELFTTKLGMTTEEATHVIEKWPKIQMSKMENLSTKIDGIAGVYSGSKQHASQAIQTLPQLVTYSVEMNMQPKAAYLRKRVFANNDGAFLDAITKCPSILGYSLENRIRPRIEEVYASGLDPRDLGVADIIVKTDEKYSKWLENKKKKLLKESLW